MGKRGKKGRRSKDSASPPRGSYGSVLAEDTLESLIILVNSKQGGHYMGIASFFHEQSRLGADKYGIHASDIRQYGH